MRRTLIPARIILQIKLVITLRIKPILDRIRLENLRRNLARFPPLLLGALRHVPGDALLLVVVVEDRAAVLGACVAALAVLGGGVVHLVEEFEEGGV